MSAGGVTDCLLGELLTVEVTVFDADGDRVVPTAFVARAGPRGTAGVEAASAADRAGAVSFDVEPDVAGDWAFQLNVMAPVKTVATGLIRVQAPEFA